MEELSTFSSQNSNHDSSLNLSQLSNSSKGSMKSPQERDAMTDKYLKEFQRLYLISMLGKGSQAQVVLCQNELQELIALKIFQKQYKQGTDLNEIHHNHMKQELSFMEMINYVKLSKENQFKKGPSPLDFIVGHKFIWESKNQLVIGLEYCPGGELFQLLKLKKRLNFNEVQFYTSNILIGLEVIHSLGVVYADLKPENILIDEDGYCKLCDFALSKKLTQKSDILQVQQASNLTSDEEIKREKICFGTLEYIAPEILKNDEVSDQSDLWAFGCLLYEMIHGMTPFFSRDQNQMISRILNAEPNLTLIKDSTLKDLLLKLLSKDLQKRFKSVQEVKQHPWFKSMKWEELIDKKVKAPFVPKNILRARYLEKHPQNKNPSPIEYLKNTQFFAKEFISLPIAEIKKIIEEMNTEKQTISQQKHLNDQVMNQKKGEMQIPEIVNTTNDEDALFKTQVVKTAENFLEQISINEKKLKQQDINIDL